MDTIERAKHIRDIAQAVIDGKVVQSRPSGEGEAWEDLEPWNVVFDFPRADYRIKPGPIVQWQVVNKDGGLCAGPFHTREAARRSESLDCYEAGMRIVKLVEESEG